MRNLVFMAVCLLLTIAGCQKDVINPSGKVSYPAPQNVVVYEVDPTIMANFQHYCQKNAGPVSTNYPNAENILSDYMASRSCGSTAYMMAAGCIAKFVDPSTTYAVNGTKLDNIVSTTGVSTNLAKPLMYGKVADASFVEVADNFGFYPSASNPTSPKVAADRMNTKNFIQQSLANDMFVIAAVNVYTTFAIVNDAKFYDPINNPDLNLTGTVTTGANKNYMTDRDESVYGVNGHIILIKKVTIDLVTGEGVVEYIDPLAKPRFDVNGNPLSNVRYVSYTRLLNSMSSNGSTANYDAIAIGKKPGNV